MNQETEIAGLLGKISLLEATLKAIPDIMFEVDEKELYTVIRRRMIQPF
ncbi:MAG: hypothetical protein IPN08_08825 [Bacteroidales bacterium]|nr:hypothetical protein [Bacteroidales bacterium]